MPSLTEKHLSRKIILRYPDGSTKEFPLSIVEISRENDGAISSILIYPFEAEIEDLFYHDTPYTIDVSEKINITIK